MHDGFESNAEGVCGWQIEPTVAIADFPLTRMTAIPDRPTGVANAHIVAARSVSMAKVYQRPFVWLDHHVFAPVAMDQVDLL